MAGKSAPKRKSVESTFADKWDPQNEGDTLEGTYVGTEKANGKRGETFNVYHIVDENDKRWSVAGAFLDSIFPQIPRDTYVWVEFTGTKKVNNGDMSLFKVDVEDGVSLIDPYDKNTPHPADTAKG